MPQLPGERADFGGTVEDGLRELLYAGVALFGRMILCIDFKYSTSG